MTQRNIAMVARVSAWPALSAMLATLKWKLGTGIRLSPSGLPPATHLGIPPRGCTQRAVDVATGVEIPSLPGHSEAEILAVMSEIHVSVTISTTDDKPFLALIASLGLKVISEPDP